MTTVGDKNIGRFDVAMNDAPCVCGVERVGDLDGPWQQNIYFQRTACDPMFQSQAINELHGDEGRRPQTLRSHKWCKYLDG